MSYSLEISDDGSYIIMNVTGSLTSKSAMLQNLAAHKLGREKGIIKFLVNAVEAVNIESPFDSYSFANKDMKSDDGLLPNAIVAILVAKEDHSHDFFETAAINAGFDIKIFRDRQAAEKYLKER